MMRPEIFIKGCSVFLVIAFFIYGCEALFNPFVGEWSSGVFRFNFYSDKKLDFVIGDTLSINLKGTYEYDEDTLTIIFQENTVRFSYEFRNGEKELVLTPETEFEYFKTQIIFRK